MKKSRTSLSIKKKVLLLWAVFCIFFPAVGEGFVERRFLYKLEDVISANKFVQQTGYWEAYQGNKLTGYVFLSMHWTPKLVGYSSKPLETLVGMDRSGIITGVKIVAYSEPIFMIGIKDADYNVFLKQYVGKSIHDPLTVGREIILDAITGATVSAVVQNATILGSARGVAAQVGIAGFAAAKPGRKISGKYAPFTWEELLKTGAVKRITVANKEMDIRDGGDVYLDLFFGLAGPPAIGRNVLGDGVYKETVGDRKPDESALFIFTSIGSFKGSGFAYGGIFSTIEVVQGGRVYIFGTDEYENISEITARGAPLVKEGGIFIVRGGNFDPTQSFKLNIILPYYVRGKKTYKTFSMEYQVPERFLK